MTPFKELTIYVDYRYYAGQSLPSDRTLRARVKCVDADGVVYGPPITRKAIRNFGELKTECVRQLHKSSNKLVFEFDAIVPPVVYRDWGLVAEISRAA